MLIYLGGKDFWPGFFSNKECPTGIVLSLSGVMFSSNDDDHAGSVVIIVGGVFDEILDLKHASFHHLHKKLLELLLL